MFLLYPPKAAQGIIRRSRQPERVTLRMPADAPALPCPACYKVEAFRLLVRRSG